MPAPAGGWSAPSQVPVEPADLAADLIAALRLQASPSDVAGMARFGINPEGTLGVRIPVLRAMVAQLRPLRRARPEYLHEVAAHLWESGVHEARILAGFLDVPALVTVQQANAWVADFDSWDVCDQVTGLFARTPFAHDLVVSWTAAQPTFTRRAGFVLICALAVHDRSLTDADLIAYLPVIEAAAIDERNFVKKAVNWALRQVGKRSPACRSAAIASAGRIIAAHPESGSARWIARDALRELGRQEPRLS
ncbi:MAG: DNA alkylation repair protein [Propionicimonas sp.]